MPHSQNKSDRHLFDLSNCGTDPNKPIHYIPEIDAKNKKRPLTMKIESGSVPDVEVVALCKKAYSHITALDGEGHQKAKGVPIRMRHEEYIKCVVDKTLRTRLVVEGDTPSIFSGVGTIHEFLSTTANFSPVCQKWNVK